VIFVELFDEIFLKSYKNKTFSLTFIISNPDYFRNWSRSCFLWGTGWGPWHSIENFMFEFPCVICLYYI